MKGITRREALWRLAAASAVGMFPSLGVAALRPAQSRQGPFQRVNVLFHGLTVIDFGSDEVHVYLPDTGSDRAYLAGSWMQETSLSRGAKYRLSGVMTGSRPVLESIDPRRDAVFRKRNIKEALSYCSLDLPFPDFVTPLRPLRKRHGKDFFTGSPWPIVHPETLPQLTVFTYVHPDPTSTLQFRPAMWTPVIQQGVVNLHVWDSPVKTPSSHASLAAFEQMARMIEAPNLGLNPVYNRIKPPRPDKNPVVEGLLCQEEWTLIERTSAPGGCGRHSRYHPKDDSGIDCLSILLY